jgi:hypothetical protein
LPDWVTHLGTAYLGTQVVRASCAGRRIQMIHVLLLGALLPDVTRFSVLLIDFLDWPAVATFAYLIPFHSLLIVSLLAASIALLFDQPRRVFGLIEVGAASHFLLDELEGQIGCGSTTFYPLYFSKPFNLWSTEGTFASLLLVVGAVGIVAALASRSAWSRPVLGRWSGGGRRTYLYSALLAAAAIVIPLFTREWVVARNAYHLGFFADPPAWEGRAVQLCFSEIVSAEPPVVEEFDTRLRLVFDEGPAIDASLTTGDWVSLRGVYRQGAIHPNLMVRHSKTSDLWLSALAGLAFVVLWLPPSSFRLGRNQGG